MLKLQHQLIDFRDYIFSILEMVWKVYFQFEYLSPGKK